MRITNDYTVKNNGLRYTNSYNNTYKNHFGVNHGDTVSFGYKILNYSPAPFSPKTQSVMKNLHKNLNELEEYVEKTFRTRRSRYAKFREDYKPLVTENKKQAGLKFRISEDETLVVIRNCNKPNLLRFIVEENGKTRIFLMNGIDKAIENVSQKNSQKVPRIPRYMSTVQIEKSGIEKYINIADDAVEKYKNYIMNAPIYSPHKPAVKKELTKTVRQTTKIQASTSGQRKSTVKKTAIKTVGQTTKIQTSSSAKRKSAIKTATIKTANPTVTAKQAKSDILGLFTTQNPTELPPHLKPIQSERSGLLGFSTLLDNGSELKVLKKTSGGFLRYISIAEKAPNSSPKYICINLETGNVLKTYEDGKPIVRCGAFLNYTPTTLRENGTNAKLVEYANHIFKSADNTKSKETFIETTQTIDEKKIFERTYFETLAEQIEEKFTDFLSLLGKIPY